MNYMDLNKVSLGNNIPLPQIDWLIHSTTKYPQLSFLDASVRYNKCQCTQMSKETAIIIERGYIAT